MRNLIMQRWAITYGLMTVVCGALATACGGDTESRRDILNQGGSGGASGATGNTGGTSGGQNTGGTSGAGNGAVGFCSGGCVELNVPMPNGPVDETAMVFRQAQYVFRPGTDTNMSTTVVTWRVRAAISTSGIPAAE